MQFDDQSKQQSLTQFTSLTTNAKAQIQQSSVRLTNGAFTGSGVLVINPDGVAGIITAKHNLYINAKKPTPTAWNDTEVNDLVVQFLTNLEVGYGDPNQPLKTQVLTLVNSDIEFHQGYGSWDYDLMFMAFKDSNLEIAKYVKADSKHGIRYGTDDLAFYKKFPDPGKSYNLFVTGFGDVLNEKGKQTSMSHPFQILATTGPVQLQRVLSTTNPNTYLDNALLTAASNKKSTAPGDSGGPMFCVPDTTKDKVYVVGATLGANYAADSLVADSPIVNNASTYLYYQSILF